MATVTLDQAGHRLRVLREAQKLTQRDIVLKTHGQLTNQQISRIERGQIEKPPMQDLVLYGNILGLTPNQLATMFGYWTGEAEDIKTAEDEPVVIRVRQLLRSGKLSRKDYSSLLRWISFAINEIAPNGKP